ncbi:hypothetical protein [Hyphomicrobium sulfonivorans]|uniref:hypothetical protein n=1 Tax=Hyphomicrobium sulfonivorans TaxID=121290 RepID=UPI001570E186|nr:hypothetical protein [Hyphomicrobium sulfonivorans]MBI1650686.1 hypothetical protein [Hyphomicrobium sulfonivorans]
MRAPVDPKNTLETKGWGDTRPIRHIQSTPAKASALWEECTPTLAVAGALLRNVESAVEIVSMNAIAHCSREGRVNRWSVLGGRAQLADFECGIDAGEVRKQRSRPVRAASVSEHRGILYRIAPLEDCRWCRIRS